MPSTPTYGGAHATAPVETATSGRIEIGQNNSLTYIAEGKHSQLLANLPQLNVVTTASDPVGAGYSAISAVLDKDGDKGVLTAVYRPIFPSTSVGGGGGGANFPSDKWSLKPQKDSVPIERHAKWVALNAVQKNIWRNAFSNGDAGQVDKARKIITVNYDTSTDLRQLYELKLAGNDTFQLTYWKYIWIHHEIFVPALSDGNVIEAPYGPGAPYLGSDLSWRREPDDLESEPGHSIVTREWVGIPSAILTWSDFLLS